MLSGPELGSAIEAARLLKGVSKADLARQFKVQPPSVQDWIRRGTIDKETLGDLWAYFADVVGPTHWGLPAAWFAPSDAKVPLVVRELPPAYRLLTRHHAGASDITVMQEALQDEPAVGYVRLPLLAEAAAGPGRTEPADGEVVQHVDVLETWLRQTLNENPANVRVLTARGHSMTGIVEDRDLMFVVPCERFEDDGVYIITVGELLRVKRLRLLVRENSISIESNDGSAPEVIRQSEAAEILRVCGRVIGAWSMRRM